VREQSAKKEDRHTAMDQATRLNELHERMHPEWTEPKSLMESLAELRADIAEAEQAHHAEHGCEDGVCICRCGCGAPTPCSKEPSLCMTCALYEDRGDDDHGEGPRPVNHARVVESLREWHRSMSIAAGQCSVDGEPGPAIEKAANDAEWHELALRKLDDLEGR
jgi:hypothetical protein